MLFLMLASETTMTVLGSNKALSIILSSMLQKLVLLSLEHQCYNQYLEDTAWSCIEGMTI